MAVRVLSSQEVQNNLPAILDASSENQDTIIARANQPVAAVIPYADYIALLDVLNRLRQKRAAPLVTTQEPAESLTTANGQASDASDSLLALAGRFASGIADTADRAEEILEAEADPVSGLSVP
ncbi:MAG: type II toxin-antitoxin system prevent-host-death family antitoxin [Caldilineaceae bacterium]